MALAFSLTAPMHLGGFGFLLGVSLCSFGWPGTHRDPPALAGIKGMQHYVQILACVLLVL